MYPPKPYIEKEPGRKGNAAVTVFSLMLFALSFVLFFGAQLGFLLQLIFVIVFHEIGHYFFMKKFNYENVRMLFVPLMGAFVHGLKDRYKQKQSILVVLAGPIPGVILGVTCWILGLEFHIEWLFQLALLLFLVNCSNLIPIFPLDGGRIVDLLFPKNSGLFHVIFTLIVSLAMIAFGYFYEMYLILIMGFLLGFQVRKMHQKYLIFCDLKSDKINIETAYENLSDQSFYMIKDIVLTYKPGLKRMVENIGFDNEEIRQIVAIEVKNTLLPPMDFNLKTSYKIAVIACWALAFFGPIYLVLQSKLFLNGAF